MFTFVSPRTAPAGKFMLKTLYVWLFVSALYYIDTLFTANFSTSYEEGIYHKAIKYAVCMTFSTYLMIRTRRYGLLVLALCLLAVGGLMGVLRGGLEISMLVMLTMGTMGGFVMALQAWERADVNIARLIVYSAVVVGLLSMVELTVLSTLFQAYYVSTSGVRSVSTLFNPNNLGMYVGVALLLLPFVPHTRRTKLILALPIVFAFLASGSRTAWLAVLVVGVCMMVCDRDAQRMSLDYLRKHAVVLAAIGFVCLTGIGMLTADTVGQLDDGYRGANLYTASIRVENFVTYVESLGWSALLPDITGANSHLIQDNFYLIALSAFGLIPLLLLGILFASQVTLYWSADLYNRQWRWVFLYFMISGLSGSFLNSFPNNQLFFISLGAFFVSSARTPREAPSRADGRIPGTSHEA